jgi:hypothetical protein
MNRHPRMSWRALFDALHIRDRVYMTFAVGDFHCACMEDVISSDSRVIIRGY